MFPSLLHKLRGAIRQTSNSLSNLGQKLRKIRGKIDLTGPLNVSDSTADISDSECTTYAIPPADFDEKLLVVAAREHSNKPISGEIYERSCPGRGVFRFSHRRDYLVYTPSGYVESEVLPLVVVLHGCRQTHNDIRAISGFDAIADRERFIVVYPFVTRYWSLRGKNCWAWWMPQHIKAGSGEVEDIGSIVKQVQDEFGVDPKRIHITGLSSGAGMTVAALVTHSNLFASGASVAGMSYGETAKAVKIHSFLSIRYRSLSFIVKRMRDQLIASSSGRLAPLLVIQSDGDQAVAMQAGLNLRDSWLEIKALDTVNIWGVEDETRGIKWKYQHYGHFGHDDSVDFLTVNELPHAWIGGLSGDYSDPRGPNISEMIWLYFNR
jgi:poly(hydroxyalkanoate) depolymerase family esterase